MSDEPQPGPSHSYGDGSDAESVELPLFDADSDGESDLDLDILSSEVDSDDASENPPSPIKWTANVKETKLEEFEEKVGVVHDLEVGASALDYLGLFLGESFFDLMAEQTNLYADQKQDEVGRKDKIWKPTTPEEMKLFLAINIFFGIVDLPREELYWSTDDRLNQPGVSSLMSRTRFEKLKKYLHLNDRSKQVPKGQTGYDPLFKVRPLLTSLLGNFPMHYKPDKEVSIDEAMVKFTGRLYLKQYVRGKPSPWGIKVWCAADPASGYLLDFDVYTGKAAKPMTGKCVC